MKILAIDTSNQALSVAIVDQDQVLVEVTTHTKLTHGERIMPTIDWAFQNSSIRLQDIDRIAVAQGPGSYTGLRIGVTTAKTLSWTLSKELVSLSSLQLVAANAPATESFLVPVFDARRDNIYTGLYQQEAGKLRAIEADQHIAADDYAQHLAQNYPGQFELVGVDAENFLKIFQAHLGDRVSVADARSHLPSAGLLAQMSLGLEPVDVHRFSPSYLKRTEAEENWIKENPDAEEGNYVQKITRMDG